MLPDPLIDLGHELWILHQEGLDVLTTLTQLLALIGEPGTRLLDEPELDADVEQRALTADAPSEGDVELRLLERWRALVFDHLDPGPVPDLVGPVLDGLDPADVQPDRRIE